MAIKVNETRVLPYAQSFVYDVIKDVGSYPKFLPWCIAANIIEETPDGMVADLVIGYKSFKETYRSKVTFTPETKIEARAEKGPLHRLHNSWTFEAVDDSNTRVTFFIEFSFKSILFQGAIEAVFSEVMKKVMGSFEARLKGLEK